MTSELGRWERKFYSAGGGDPFLLYVVYGIVDSSIPLSRSTYRSNGVPDGVELMSYGPGNEPGVPGSFREGYPWTEWVAEDPELAATAEDATHCMILRGSPTDATALDYLRDTVGVITFLLDHGGCAVYDPLMFRWWSPAHWKRDLFDPASAVPLHHVAILVSEEEDPSLSWYHTRGMRKFGRPDISIHNVASELGDSIVELCDRLIEHQALGHVVPDGQEIRMPSLPAGGVIHHGGHLQDPEFNNVHIEVTWPTRSGTP